MPLKYTAAERAARMREGRQGGGGGGGSGGGGGAVRGVREAQTSKPPETTDPSDCHVIVVPAAMNTLNGALSEPRYWVVPKVM